MSWRKSSYSAENGGNCVEVSWRKSSRSAENGGQCVEVGWRKSSRSAENGGACVEVAGNLSCLVAVRDSKDPDGPRLVFTSTSWQAFTTQVKAGRHALT